MMIRHRVLGEDVGMSPVSEYYKYRNYYFQALDYVQCYKTTQSSVLLYRHINQSGNCMSV